MADVVDFPAREVAPDCLPQPGDRYHAYALWHHFEPPMIAFVFSTWGMTALRYDGLVGDTFRPLSEDGSYDGKCVISLTFCGVSGAVKAVITGRNLYRLYSDLAEHRVHWLWELPEGRAVVGDGEPVIRSIIIQDAAPCGDIVAQGDAETTGFNTEFVPSD
jgi:hypothetical protein